MAQLLLLFLTISVSISSISPLTHNESCTATTASCTLPLICHPETLKCTCPYGPLTGDLIYNLTWTDTNCYASLGSACIGTEEHLPQGATNSGVKCGTGLKCAQVEKLPLGIGTCGEDNGGGIVSISSWIILVSSGLAMLNNSY